MLQRLFAASKRNKSMVPVYCITLDLKGARAKRTLEEFAAYAITPKIVRGLDAHKWGLKTTIEFHRNLGEPYYLWDTVVGCSLSHWMLWNYLLTANVPEALIVEDDVKLRQNFLEEFNACYAELPQDWQFAFVGRCCAADKPTKQITPRVWDIRWPLCTHAYLVKLSALEIMMDPMAEARAPFDIALTENVFAKGLIKPYTFKPNLALQHDTFLPY